MPARVPVRSPRGTADRTPHWPLRGAGTSQTGRAGWCRYKGGTILYGTLADTSAPGSTNITTSFICICRVNCKVHHVGWLYRVNTRTCNSRMSVSENGSKNWNQKSILNRSLTPLFVCLSALAALAASCLWRIQNVGSYARTGIALMSPNCRATELIK